MNSTSFLAGIKLCRHVCVVCVHNVPHFLGMGSWNLKTTATPTTLSTSWTGRTCAASVWSSNMPAALGETETETATVGLTRVVVVGAVSAVYYKIPSLPFAAGVRCPSGLHREQFIFNVEVKIFFFLILWSSGPSVKVRDQQAIISRMWRNVRF